MSGSTSTMAHVREHPHARANSPTKGLSPYRYQPPTSKNFWSPTKGLWASPSGAAVPPNSSASYL